MRKALITGINGQDGAYLAKVLLEKGYEVYGLARRSSTQGDWRLKRLNVKNDIKVVECDLTEFFQIFNIVKSIEPDEIYNLAAQSFVGYSFDNPINTLNVDGAAVLYLLESIRILNPKIKFYQASTSEMFGKVQAIPQVEDTPFYPRSPYGVAKLYGHWITKNYRESYNIFASSGILFNHESPLRGAEFVTRKITYGIAQIQAGDVQYIEVGNIDAKRDWGFAGDYVLGMHLMLQAKEPDDYVLATNRTHTIRYMIEQAFKTVDVEIKWQGTSDNEIGIDAKTGTVRIKVNPKFYRPAEVELLVGNPIKAKTKLGWEPQMSFESLIKYMVEEDLKYYCFNS